MKDSSGKKTLLASQPGTSEMKEADEKPSTNKDQKLNELAEILQHIEASQPSETMEISAEMGKILASLLKEKIEENNKHIEASQPSEKIEISAEMHEAFVYLLEKKIEENNKQIEMDKKQEAMSPRTIQIFGIKTNAQLYAITSGGLGIGTWAAGYCIDPTLPVNRDKQMNLYIASGLLFGIAGFNAASLIYKWLKIKGTRSSVDVEMVEK